MKVRHDSRTKVLLYFLLGIALPSGLLAYLAFRGIHNERALIERERRIELAATTDTLRAGVREKLMELGRSVAGADAPGLLRLVQTDLTLSAIFSATPGEGVRIVAADGLFFGTPEGSVATDATGRFQDELRSARRLEIAADQPTRALELYKQVFDGASSDALRGDALMAMARIHRRTGEWSSSLQAYEKLSREFDQVRTGGGLPLGPAATLEAASLYLERGDTAYSVQAGVELYTDLVTGHWILTAPQFDYLASAVQGIVEPITALAGATVRDTVDRLEEAHTRQRARAARLQEFESSATRLLARSDLSEQTVGASVDIGGDVFPVVLLDRHTDTASGRRGFVFEPEALVAIAAREVLGTDSSQFSWVLKSPADPSPSSPSAPPPASALAAFTDLPGYPRWSLRLSYTPEALEEGFLDSRSGAYLIAFVLIAGILISGLVLTVRTVGRELELARMKSDFVSTVSHEFKSPLTAIRQLAEMLKTGRVASEERRSQYYDVLLEQSERLSVLVENVLDFARTDAGRRPFVFESVAPAELVREVVDEARQRVAHESFDFRLYVDSRLPHMSLDRYAFRQALGNLIDNAIKYSGASREIIVAGHQRNGDLVVSVQDFGIGLDSEQAARAFERFYRGGNELTRNVRGTGLGLAVVKQIVDAHGGTVSVVSETGCGSTFSMQFPIGTRSSADHPTV